jgi:hypothetical protein
MDGYWIKGVPENPQLAMQFYRLGADRGSAKAKEFLEAMEQRPLARLIHDGDGTGWRA